MKKRIFCLLAVAVLCLSVLLPATAKTNLPAPTDDFFVNDFAGCLTAADAAEMQRLGETLYRDTRAQVVIVTVSSLDGEEIEDYGYDLANEWGIGEEQADSGVLLLLSTGDREVRIEVGKGLEGCLPDGKTGRILDNYAIPYLKENDFSTGLAGAYRVLVNEVYTEYGQTPSDYVPIEDVDDSFDTTEISYFFGSAAPFLIVLLLVVASLAYKRGGGSSGRGSGGGFTGSYYGGGFSGGSSHSSGGGGFHGGGGSFGGGGSSRGF